MLARIHSIQTVALCASMAVSVVLDESEARAFECTAKAPLCSVSARWKERSIPYVIRTPPPDASMTEDELITAVHESFEVWSSVGCTHLEFQFMGVLGPDEQTDVPNEIKVFTKGWRTEGRTAGNEREVRSLGITSASWQSYSGRLRTSVIELNDEFHDFGDVPALPNCRGVYDLRATLIHEIGHFIGIAHPCEYQDESGSEVVEVETPLTSEGNGTAECEEGKACPRGDCDEQSFPEGAYPTMWPLQSACDASLRNLEADDVEAVCFIYPREGESRACYAVPEVAGDEDLVGNVAFGCTTSHRETARGSGLWGLLILGVAALMRPRESA